MTTSPPPNTPTVAIARILRRLGLTQGRGKDFRVEGTYRGGERIGTHVLTLSRRADETVAARADEIERLSKDGPFPFRVSVRYPSGPRLFVSTSVGPGVRTCFGSTRTFDGECPPPPVAASFRSNGTERVEPLLVGAVGPKQVLTDTPPDDERGQLR